MYKILIGLAEVAQTESLAEACHTFISKVQAMIKDEGCSLQILLEACMITTKINGVGCMMNFYAIRDFSHGIGILNEEGKLSDNPVPYIPKEIAEQIIIAANNDSVAAYMEEHSEVFARLAIVQSKQDEQGAEPQIIT